MAINPKRRLFPVGAKVKWDIAIKWFVIAMIVNEGVLSSRAHSEFGVPERTVRTWWTRYEATGDVTTGKHAVAVGSGGRVLGRGGKRALAALVRDNPWMYLDEYCAALAEAGFDASEASVCRTLKRMGLGLKNLNIIASQRLASERQHFWNRVAHLNPRPEQLVFVDESAISSKKLQRRRGRALAQDVARKFLVGGGDGKHRSLIAACNIGGMILPACALRLETTDGDSLSSWFELHLAPLLGNFDRGEPNSLVIMDNASVHDFAQLQALARERGAIILPLSPYSPDFNPIESTFSKIKSVLRRRSGRGFRAYPELSVWQAMAKVTASDMRGYFRNCGYSVPAEAALAQARDAEVAAAREIEEEACAAIVCVAAVLLLRRGED
jgi:transposase